MSESIAMESGSQPLDEARAHTVMQANDAMASDGLRVLALASGPVANATRIGGSAV